MTKIYFTSLIFLISFNLFSQSQNYNNVLEQTLIAAEESGYYVLDFGKGELNSEYGALLQPNDQKNFSVGDYYMAIVIDNCSDCNAEFVFQDLDSGKITTITPKMHRSTQNISVASYNFKQDINGHGHVQALLKGKIKRYSTALLLKKN